MYFIEGHINRLALFIYLFICGSGTSYLIAHNGVFHPLLEKHLQEAFLCPGQGLRGKVPRARSPQGAVQLAAALPQPGGAPWLQPAPSLALQLPGFAARACSCLLVALPGATSQAALFSSPVHQALGFKTIGFTRLLSACSKVSGGT